MKINYTFANGETSDVEVNEEIGNLILDSRREESNQDRKERYHCYSLDAAEYEGEDYADGSTPETELFLQLENQRIKEAFRLVFPLTRDVTPEEFVAVSRYLAQMLGIDYFDECSYQPNQLMYWPSTPANGSFVYKETDGPWLDPDSILSEHPEWTDPTRLPTSSRESKANTTAQQKVQDPLTKEGVVGLFNRTYYPISKALEAFLSDVYEPTDNESRWHLIASSSMAGVEIKEDKFVYSHHAKDPAYLKMCNAFDIIRIHRFGDLDDKASYKAMCEFAMEQDEVKMLAASERTAGAETDFSGGEDIDWQKHLQYEPRSMVLKNNLHNITLIMENDPNLKGIVFNQLADGLEIKGEVPWKHPARFWRDADDAQLISFVDSHYGSFSERNYRIAVTKVTDDRSYHPIRERQKHKYYYESSRPAHVRMRVFRA